MDAFDPSVKRMKYFQLAPAFSADRSFLWFNLRICVFRWYLQMHVLACTYIKAYGEISMQNLCSSGFTSFITLQIQELISSLDAKLTIDHDRNK